MRFYERSCGATNNTATAASFCPLIYHKALNDKTYQI
jgi:hypothetical protein